METVYFSEKNIKSNEIKYLIIPSVLRGVGNGIIGFIVSIGIRGGIFNTGTATGLTVITSVSAVLGNFVYLILEKRVNNNKTNKNIK